MRALTLLLVCACGSTAVDEPPPRLEVAQFPAVESRALDILLLVDNSSGTAHWQQWLGADMPALLASLADGGPLPDLHVGVITPDLGTTGSQSTVPARDVGTVGDGGCAGDGDGALVRTVIVDVADGAGGRTRNYDGSLDAALAGALRIGSTGCGFEQHLHAIRRALTVNGTALWRPAASTAVIALVDEDDCSVLAPGFFDSNALGPLNSFRCARLGVTCDEPLDAIGAKTNCRADTSSPWIEDPQLTKTALDDFRGTAKVTFSAIAGPGAPITVEERQQGGTSQLALAHGCDLPTPQGTVVADPSPRLAALVDSFASRGHLHSICQPSYAPALAAIAKTIERSLGVACLDDALAVDLAACVAHEFHDGLRTELPACPAATDCFTIAPDTARCGGGPRVTIDRKSPPVATAHVEVACAR